MNEHLPEAAEAAEEDHPRPPGVGAKALALAGFAEAVLADDPTGHGGIMTWTYTSYAAEG